MAATTNTATVDSGDCQDETKKRPSFFSRWLAGGSAPGGADDDDDDGASSPAKDELVQKLKRQLEENQGQDEEERTFTLTARELRLLLDLPPPTIGDATVPPGGTPPPPPVHDLPELSSVFDAWDFTTHSTASTTSSLDYSDSTNNTADLSGDEIQAIMIALAADRDCEAQAEGGGALASPQWRPAPAKRQVSIQAISTKLWGSNSNRSNLLEEDDDDDEDDIQFLVTLGDGDTVAPPPPPSFFSDMMASPQFDATRALLSRSFSIQPCPLPENHNEDEDEEETTDKLSKPDTLSTRQISVQQLSIPDDHDKEVEGEATTTDGSNHSTRPKSIRYLISIPKHASASTLQNKRHDRAPQRVVRQVTVQPAYSTSDATCGNKDHPPVMTQRRPTLHALKSLRKLHSASQTNLVVQSQTRLQGPTTSSSSSARPPLGTKTRNFRAVSVTINGGKTMESIVSSS